MKKIDITPYKNLLEGELNFVSILRSYLGLSKSLREVSVESRMAKGCVLLNIQSINKHIKALMSSFKEYHDSEGEGNLPSEQFIKKNIQQVVSQINSMNIWFDDEF